MIATLLRDRIGLNVDSLGRGKLDADVAQRMEACGVIDILSYERLLNSSKGEFDELIKILTIPETWFFRAYDSFIFLEEHLQTEWLPSLVNAPRRLRTLSIPCSTGEEPYSIAMTYLRCGLPPAYFSIEAYDINAANLERAAQGIYTKNSFRSELQWFKPLHFTECNGRFALEQSVKDCVEFKQGNLLELRPPSSEDGLYDIVFCRNLLIYFDEASQRKALDILTSCLRDGGLLFLGHAESTSLLFGRPFSPVQAKGSFAFKKVKPKDMPALWDPTDTQRLLKIFRSPETPSQRQRSHSPQRLVVKAVKPPVQPLRTQARPAPPRSPATSEAVKEEGLLANAQALADKGLLKEAAEFCRRHIAKSKLDPEGYFLLGIIYLSMKMELDAENCLNKAIFLNPDHSEALLSLAALKDGRGDSKGAELCRRRAGREGMSK